MNRRDILKLPILALTPALPAPLASAEEFATVTYCYTPMYALSYIRVTVLLGHEEGLACPPPSA